MRKKVLFLMLISCVIGFLIGSAVFHTKEKVEYVKGEPVSASIPNDRLEPVKETKPLIPVLPVRADTIWRDSVHHEIKYVVQKVDTAAIINDYLLKRDYDILAFDDNKGKLQLYPTVQYNRLVELDYEFTPVIKNRTINTQRVWTPFVSAGWSSLHYISVGGGAFYHDLGLEYQYLRGYNNNPSGHLITGKWKF